MNKYTTNQIIKTLEKLFVSDYTTSKKIKSIKWEQIDVINQSFTPLEKSLLMDFRDAVSKNKIIEFLAGKEFNEEKGEDKK